MRHQTGRSSATMALALLCLAKIVVPGYAQTAPIEGTIFGVVGGGNGDGAAQANATIDPRGLIIVRQRSGADDLYIADGANHRVRHVDAALGIITTLAGSGAPGYGGDNGPSEKALLSSPLDVAMDASGNLYIADSANNRIRRVDPNNTITTFAGSGSYGYSGDGGSAVQAALGHPNGVAACPDGNIYIADSDNNRIRKVTPKGVISTVAGTGQIGYGGDDGPATLAKLWCPTAVICDSLSNLYIADMQNQRVRFVDAKSGIITTIAGTGTMGYTGDGDLAVRAALKYPMRLALDGKGNLYVSVVGDSSNGFVRYVDARGYMWPLAGSGTAGSDGDGGAALRAQLDPVGGVAATLEGEVYVSVIGQSNAVSPRNRVRWIDASRIIHPAVGGGIGDGGPAVDAVIDPRGVSVAIDQRGNSNLYIADGKLNRIRQVDGRTGVIQTIAGTGVAGYSGDGGPATKAALNMPYDVVAVSDGSLVVADYNNNAIRRIASDGTITTIAGTGAIGTGCAAGPATRLGLYYPTSVTIDRNGNVLIADRSNNCIRRVSPLGAMDTVAGTGKAGFGGDGGAATTAQLNNPSGVVADEKGGFYIADAVNSRIRYVDSQGNIRTITGNGYAGFSGDGGAALFAQVNVPSAVDIDGFGNLFITDSRNQRMRWIDASTGLIYTVAGNGSLGDDGDGGSAVLARVSDVSGVGVDPTGTDLFVSQSKFARVRHVVFKRSAVTSTPTPTMTWTPGVPATPTNVSTSTPVPSLTRTPLPSTTTTSTSTRTAIATRTSTITRTSTLTSTPTRTSTSVPSWTPTRTSTITPTNTPAAVAGSISGYIRYYNGGAPVPAATVALAPVGSVPTAPDGQYAFPSLNPSVCQVAPAKGGDITAVSALDASYILQAVVGKRALNGNQSLACDVSGDGKVTPLDASRILQFVVGKMARFPVATTCNSDWAFVPNPLPAPNQGTAAPSVSAGNCQAGAISFDPLSGTASDQNFLGVLFGDCTGNWQPAGAAALAVSMTEQPSVRLGRPRSLRGGRVSVPVYVQTSKGLNALEAKIGYDRRSMRAVGVRLRAAAGSAIVNAKTDQPGMVTIALASADTIDAHGGTLLTIEFTRRSARAAGKGMRILDGMVDERPIVVAP